MKKVLFFTVSLIADTIDAQLLQQLFGEDHRLVIIAWMESVRGFKTASTLTWTTDEEVRFIALIPGM
jgi:hypothetical protein